LKYRLFFITVLVIFAIPGSVWAQDSSGEIEEKLYNFDDMLIDGSFRDPQGMFERARSEAKFEGVLKLERSFMSELENNAQESSMRP
jgi:hypothetical protein